MSQVTPTADDGESSRPRLGRPAGATPAVAQVAVDDTVSPAPERTDGPEQTDEAEAESTDPKADGSDPEADEAAKQRRIVRTVIEWMAVIGGALLVAMLIKMFLVEAFWIPSPSMRPTLAEGDRVLVNKLADDIDDLSRGDIVVFKRPEGGTGGQIEDGINDLIKRVVGLPGDELEARNGVLYVNGQRLDEPYVDDATPTHDMEPFEVPEGHIFVMGDNRTNSQDSRYFGPVPDENIVGRAFVRFWPLGNLGRL